MKFLRKLKRRKGFTLTELIVAVAIIAILMAMVAAFSQPVQRMTSGTTDRGDSLKINEIIGNYLERRLAYADSIKVFEGYTYSSAGDVSSAYDVFKGKAENSFKKKKDGSISDVSKYKTQTGMLVLHFNEVTETDEQYTSSFEIYDVPIYKNSDMPASIDAIRADDSYKVFNDEFFGKYQYFITTDQTAFPLNQTTHKTNLSFRIESYNFDTSHYMKSETITSYYNHIDDPATYTSDPFEKLINYRTGVENVSFTFENISPYRTSAGIYESSIRSNTAEVIRGSAATHGTDIIVFYNVRNYNPVSDINS